MALESSSHWYDSSGNPKHTVVGKNGKERAVTIRDARALGLLPSVTTVLKILAAPQLQQWRERQVALAALTYPKSDTDVLDDAFLDRVREDAFKQVSDAADLGTNIHAALEAFFSNQPHDPQYDVYVNAVDRVFQSEGVHILQRELNLANPKEGYAGKTDLIIDSAKGLGIGDYKTRKSKPQYAMEPYEDQPTQVAAYCMAHFGEISDRTVGFNLYVSTTEPGRVEIAWYDSVKLREEWEVFHHLLEVWFKRKNYDPRKAT